MKLSSLFSKGKNHGTKTPRSFTEINNNDVADDFESVTVLPSFLISKFALAIFLVRISIQTETHACCR